MIWILLAIPVVFIFALVAWEQIYYARHPELRRPGVDPRP